MTLRTENQVRDYAKEILGFDEIEENINQGTGQITTFNQLGFKEYSDKPDGWYLPKNMNDVAIILETKSEERDISKQIFIDELIKNIDIISEKIIFDNILNNLNDKIIIYITTRQPYSSLRYRSNNL